MSKIISITPTGQWQDLFKLEVRFDNGDFGTAFAKSQTPPYAVGEEVEYTKNEKGTVKIQRPNPYGGGGGYTQSAPSFASKPTAVLLDAVLFCRAALPTATLLAPVMLKSNDCLPIEVLFPPVVVDCKDP